MVWILSLHEAIAPDPEQDPEPLQELPPAPTVMPAAASEFEWCGREYVVWVIQL